MANKITLIIKIRRAIISFIMKLPMSGYMRGRLATLYGVKHICTGGKKRLFVGEGVCFDRVAPQLIEIGNGTTIATGAIILTHQIDTELPPPGFKFKLGVVKIGHACFIGANSIICNSVEIGDNSIVAAGAIVTKNIPPNEIWGGNPARFIKKRPSAKE